MAHASNIAELEIGQDQLFGKHTIEFQHRLLDTGLFSHETLAQVIENMPAENYNLNTMGSDHDNADWREGRLGRTSGREAIETIRRGRMWLNLRKFNEVDPRYGSVLDQVMQDFEDKVPGLKTFKRQLGVLISSPNVRIFYHADVPGQSLWQIEGTKKLYVYPNTEPFLRPQDMEKIVLGMTEEEIPYKPWFDKYAKIYHLQPGQAVHWPLNGPHQVINDDCLNISVTTAHWTGGIRNAYAVNYANGVLRNTFGLRPTATKPEGLHVYPKAALALLWKSLNLHKGQALARRVDFEIDPDAETGMRRLETAIAK